MKRKRGTNEPEDCSGPKLLSEEGGSPLRSAWAAAEGWDL